MVPFSYSRASDGNGAVQTAAPVGQAANTAHVQAPVQYLGGGTTLVDLMKLGVMQPGGLVDITGLEKSYGAISAQGQGGGLKIGALARMSEVAAHPVVQRDYPVISESLLLAASQQLRNMARVGGNVLQRTRCNYFRDPSFAQCNKRNPGSGCAALDGFNRTHAVLGVSEQCIATYPGDFAQALLALDATVEVLGPNGARVMKFSDLHRAPGTTPQVETNLRPGELITAFNVDGGPWTQSRYVKVRDRDSYAFALASAAVALKMNGDTVQEARIALGGVAAKPWRATEAEAALQGKPLDENAATAAAAAAFAQAKTQRYNAYKVKLGQATLVRALLETKEMQA